jgi:hypothetical protein
MPPVSDHELLVVITYRQNIEINTSGSVPLP